MRFKNIFFGVIFGFLVFSVSATNQDSGVVKIEKAQDNTKILAILGAGATVYMGLKAKAVCATCPGPKCWACGPMWIATAYAGYETIKLFTKEKEYQEIKLAMCAEGKQCGADDEEDDDEEDEEDKDEDKDEEDDDTSPDDDTTSIASTSTADTPPTSEVPGCKGQLAECNDVINWATTNSSCADNDSTCDDTSTAVFMGNDTKMPKGLTDIFKPNDWPKDKPFPVKIEALSYDNLTSEQKNELQNMLEPLQKEQEDFMEEYLDYEDDEVEPILGGIGSTSTFANTGTETGAGTPSKKFTLFKLQPSKYGLKKDKNLMSQMQGMLKKMYGKKGRKKSRSVARKSIQKGTDMVGEEEDNIFMMIHRRHRVLDKGDHFTSSSGAF